MGNKVQNTIQPVLSELFQKLVTFSVKKELTNIKINIDDEKNIKKYGVLSKMTMNGFDRRLFFLFDSNLVYTNSNCGSSSNGNNNISQKFEVSKEVYLSES